MIGAEPTPGSHPNAAAVTLASVTPRRSTASKVRDVVIGVLTLAVLVWAWRAGEIDILKAWENRDRFGSMVFGPQASAEDLAKYREQELRLIRRELAGVVFSREAAAQGITQTWEEFRFGLGEEGPRWPAWLIAGIDAEVAAMGDEVERRVEAGVREQAEQKGTGLVPPELSPTRIFGNPDVVFKEDSGFRRFAESLPGPVAAVLLHAGATLNEEGYIGKLIETVSIAVWATLFAFLLALPMSVLGAKRTARLLVTGSGGGSSFARGLLVFVARRSFDVTRGFNEVILALLLVWVLNIGPFPGLVALAAHTYGVLGKVFSDAIEAASEGPIEGVKASGAGSVQTISYAVLPQIMPFVISQTLLRFESNVRGAAILGVVGAGGIGMMLNQKVAAYAFDEVGTMLILLIITVALIDTITTRVMKKFI